MSQWNYPVTDTELDNFWGPDVKPLPSDAACSAIRAIHFIDFDPECAQAIIAVLVEKMLASQFTKKKEEAIELLELAFRKLDK